MFKIQQYADITDGIAAEENLCFFIQETHASQGMSRSPDYVDGPIPQIKMIRKRAEPVAGPAAGR